MMYINRKWVLPLLGVIALTLGVEKVNAAQGQLWAGGLDRHLVYKFDANGNPTVLLGVPGPNPSNPDSIAFDIRGNLFVADTANHRIVEIHPDTSQTTFASQQSGEVFVPGGLAFDTAGNLYVSSAQTGDIFKFTPAGTRTTYSSGINGPSGLAFDAQGNLYVSEANTGKILKIAPGGGTPTAYVSGLSNPAGLAFDGTGKLYVVDVGSSSVRIVSPTSNTAFAIGLSSPRFIAFDRSGNLFVSTLGTLDIKKVTPNGVVTTFTTSSVHASGLAFEPATALVANISTRASVQTGAGVTIAGFSVTGTDVKKVLIRGLGPTLGQPQFNVPGPLQDPTLALHNSAGTTIDSNDDWQTHANANQIPQNLRPPDSRESAILANLQPGNYTAILAGKNGTTGIGLVEVYDLNSATLSQLTNISTRGFVGTNDAVMIGGFALTNDGNGSTRVLVRALGPTLGQPPFNIAGALADPTLTLVNANGQTIASNDNWQTQQAEVVATGFAPPNTLEAAIAITLSAGNYTAIVQGNNGGTGIALVEVYKFR